MMPVPCSRIYAMQMYFWIVIDTTFLRIMIQRGPYSLALLQLLFEGYFSGIIIQFLPGSHFLSLKDILEQPTFKFSFASYCSCGNHIPF